MGEPINEGVGELEGVLEGHRSGRDGRGSAPDLIALYPRKHECVRTETPVDVSTRLSFWLCWEGHEGFCGGLQLTVAEGELEGLGLTWRCGFNVDVLVENPGREESVQRTAGVDANTVLGLDHVRCGREHHEVTQHCFWRLAFTAVQKCLQVRGNSRGVRHGGHLGGR